MLAGADVTRRKKITALGLHGLRPRSKGTPAWPVWLTISEDILQPTLSSRIGHRENQQQVGAGGAELPPHLFAQNVYFAPSCNCRIGMVLSVLLITPNPA
jgi:hypothetical protein